MADKQAARRRQNLPDPAFVSTTASTWPGRLMPCADLWGGYALDDPVLASTPLKKAGWATLFAYMHRRFGPPHVAGDDYKDLCAGWMLVTPDQHVFVLVRPSLNGPGFSFVPYVAVASDTGAIRAREISLGADRVSEIQGAYRALLLDLLRPVCVRDSHINALGELGNRAFDQALLAWDDAEDRAVYEVRFHSSSGYAMPVGMFGGEDWATLCGLIRQFGAGDYRAGRAALIDQLQQVIFAEAAEAGCAVHRLMLLGAGKHRSTVATRLDIDAEAVAAFDQEMVSLREPEGADRAFVDEMTDAAFDTAIGYLVRLGLGAGDLAKTVRRLRDDKAVAEAWAEVVAIASDDFPDEALRVDLTLQGSEFPAGLKMAFEMAGRQDLASWVDKTLARPAGADSLADIIRHIAKQTRERA